MSRAVHWSLLGVVVLVLLAGCGRNYFAAREPWRREAEATCLKSGAVKESRNVVRVTSIDGPGVCGADFPLKVTALGGNSALGFGPDLRPPGGIPGAPPAQQPRWPINEQYSPEPPPVMAQPTRPVDLQPLPPPPSQYPSPQYAPPVQRAPVMQQTPQQTLGPADLRPSPLMPPPASPSRKGDQFGVTAAAPTGAPASAPMSLRAPSLGRDDDVEPPYDFRRPYANANAPVEPRTPEPRYQPRYPMSNARPLSPPPSTRAALPPAPPVVPLGRDRGPAVTGTIAAAISPPATLACPMVSALDNWIATVVQPSAVKWFRQQVVEIKQISAYSCRGMNGNPNARISEHAFGNALDIAAFTLADGTKITVKNGWRGSAEEQGFLRDVQGGACEQFHTVLAPGSNVYHYDHIHVDLMRRRGTACNPKAVPGDVVAARVRAQQQNQFARRPSDPGITGSIGRMVHRVPPKARVNDNANGIYGGEVYEGLPNAIAGEDDQFEDDAN